MATEEVSRYLEDQASHLILVSLIDLGRPSCSLIATKSRIKRKRLLAFSLKAKLPFELDELLQFLTNISAVFQ